MKTREKTQNTKNFQNFEVFFENLRKYWWLAALIPLLIGGFSQFISLTKLDISYLRLFSKTQLLNDGVMLIVTLAIFVFLFAGIPILLLKNKLNIWYKLALGLSFCVIVAYYLEKIYFASEKGEIIGYIFLIILFSATPIFIFLSFFRSFENKILIIFQTFYLCLILIITYLICIFIILGDHFMIPKNLQNTENITCPENKTCTLKYFNDKYLFIEEKINNSEDKKIRIEPFENIFRK